MPTLRFGAGDLGAASPLAILALGAIAILLAGAILRGRRGSPALPWIALGTAALAALAAAGAWSAPRIAAGGALATGPFAVFVSLIVLGAVAVATLYSIDYARRMGFDTGEYYALILLSAAGMLYLVAANDLVSLFIAFETMSLAIYALAGISRTDARSGEGAMKYFVLGSFSSAFLLYGLALLYGASGSIFLDDPRPLDGLPEGIASVVGRGAAAGPANGLVLGALGLIVAGFAFKVGAVPFHSWVPDAYQGAPASVTGFMAVAVKAAAFAVFLRLLHAAGLLAGDGPGGIDAPGPAAAAGVLWILAVATMVLANLAALVQTSVQRMLAYSSIAHSGYVLVGFVAATQDRTGDAAAGALFYLVAYGAMTIGAFGVLTVVRREGRPIEQVDDLAGLAWERPGAAAAMMLFMISLIGIPPTAGFMGKLWVFRAAVQAEFPGLVVIALVTTAVSIYYYLRVVVVMFMAETAPVVVAAGGGAVAPREAHPDPEAAPRAPSGANFGGTFAIALAAAATLLFGVFPAWTLGQATRSVAALFAR